MRSRGYPPLSVCDVKMGDLRHIRCGRGGFFHLLRYSVLVVVGTSPPARGKTKQSTVPFQNKNPARVTPET